MTQRKKPSLVVVNGKTFIDRRIWNDDLMSDHIMEHGEDKWLALSDLARTAYGRNDETNRRRAARHFSKVRKIIRKRGKVLLYDSDPRNRRILAVKICDPLASHDLQRTRELLEWMRTRNQMTAEEYEETLLVLHGAEDHLPDTSTAQTVS